MAKVIPYKVWVQDEIITVADLNQVAENADPRRDFTQQFNHASAINTQNAATWGVPIFISHTSRTGRIRVHVQVSIENTTGATIDLSHNIAYDTTVALATTVTGSATNGLVDSRITTGGEHFVTFQYILTGIPVGTLYYYGYANRRTAGAGVGVIRSYLIYAEDI